MHHSSHSTMSFSTLRIKNRTVEIFRRNKAILLQEKRTTIKMIFNTQNIIHIYSSIVIVNDLNILSIIAVRLRTKKCL